MVFFTKFSLTISPKVVCDKEITSVKHRFTKPSSFDGFQLVIVDFSYFQVCSFPLNTRQGLFLTKLHLKQHISTSYSVTYTKIELKQFLVVNNFPATAISPATACHKSCGEKSIISLILRYMHKNDNFLQ